MELKVNGKSFNLLSAASSDEIMAGHRRDVLTMHINGSSYAELSETLVDGAELTIVDDAGNEFRHVEYSKAGTITDNRDGTYACKMGYPNTIEQDLQDEVNTARQEIVQAQAVTKVLAGQGVATVEAAQAMRATIESAAALLSDSQAAAVPSLSKLWVVGESVKTGDRRYYPPTDRLYKCVQPHTTQADWTPDLTPAMWAVIDIAHAGTQDDPIPAAAGMEYEYGKYYSDPDNSKIYLCKRIGEADGGKIVLHYLPHELIGQYFEEV